MKLLRLKELLSEKQMTGKQLAEMVGVTPASISNIVQENSFPKPELLVKIAESLEVEVSDLFTSSQKNSQTIYVKDGKNFKPIGILKI